MIRRVYRLVYSAANDGTLENACQLSVKHHSGTGRLARIRELLATIGRYDPRGRDAPLLPRALADAFRPAAGVATAPASSPPPSESTSFWNSSRSFPMRSNRSTLTSAATALPRCVISTRPFRPSTYLSSAAKFSRAAALVYLRIMAGTPAVTLGQADHPIVRGAMLDSPIGDSTADHRRRSQRRRPAVSLLTTIRPEPT